MEPQIAEKKIFGRGGKTDSSVFSLYIRKLQISEFPGYQAFQPKSSRRITGQFFTHEHPSMNQFTKKQPDCKEAAGAADGFSLISEEISGKIN